MLYLMGGPPGGIVSGYTVGYRLPFDLDQLGRTV